MICGYCDKTITTTLINYINTLKAKQTLVEQATSSLHDSCLSIIEMITSQGFNPIKENFEIKKIFKEMFKNASSSPIYQLKKYYPDIYEKVMKKVKNDAGEIVEKEEAKTHVLYIKGDVKQKKAAPAGTPAKKKSIIEK